MCNHLFTLLGGSERNHTIMSRGVGWGWMGWGGDIPYLITENIYPHIA